MEDKKEELVVREDTAIYKGKRSKKVPRLKVSKFKKK